MCQYNIPSLLLVERCIVHQENYPVLRTIGNACYWQDHTFSGIMFDVVCKGQLPVKFIEIQSCWVRGALGPMQVQLVVPLQISTVLISTLEYPSFFCLIYFSFPVLQFCVCIWKQYNYINSRLPSCDDALPLCFRYLQPPILIAANVQIANNGSSFIRFVLRLLRWHTFLWLSKQQTFLRLIQVTREETSIYSVRLIG